MSRIGPPIEVLATSVAAARLALLGGADRVELCENDPQGGTTPSAGTIETALELAEPHGTPVHVMIRPRGGGFVYDRDEQATMLRDIATAVRLGAHGLVVGAMTAEGDVDVDLLQRLIWAGSGLSVTFHRAVDVARTIEVAVEMAFDLGCDRVLTSGGAATAVDGAAMLARLVGNAPDGRIVMAGGGPNSEASVATIAMSNATLQLHSDSRFRGRVMSLFSMALIGSTPSDTVAVPNPPRPSATL